MRAGRFAVGHKLSVGNRASLHRRKIDEAIDDSDIDLALNGLRRILMDEKARGQEIVSAARELLDRAGGRPASSDLEDRVSMIETGLARLLEHLGAEPQ